MSKPYIVIPDTHGKIDVVNWALAQLEEYDLVFLGDYLDSFTSTRNQQISTLGLVLTAAEMYPDRVTALMGNHELSYLDPAMRASGYKKNMDYKVQPYKERMLKLLKPYTWRHGYLLSHAGVTRHILDIFEITLQDYLNSGQFNDIGKSRGGWSPYGGLYWCDWHDDFVPIDNVQQIVGHTAYRYVKNKKGKKDKIISKADKYGNLSYNVDCLDQKGKKHFLEVRADGTVHKLKVDIYA